ncbi:MAG: hypothetical protein AVDCRST_MAG56-1449, partial [uncultured Cytophagales bacterium]
MLEGLMVGGIGNRFTQVAQEGFLVDCAGKRKGF